MSSLTDEPFRRVTVDLVEPIIPMLGRKNCDILVTLNYAAHYSEAVILPGVEAIGKCGQD